MKPILLFILLFGFEAAVFAQEKTILKILNRELKREVKHQLESSFYNGDTIRIIQEFKIDENKILSFKIKKTSSYFSGYQIITQKVSLDSIVKIAKDIPIILETENKDVVTHYIKVDGDTKEETLSDRFFYLYFEGDKQNDDLGIELQKAFDKAGYSIDKERWYED